MAAVWPAGPEPMMTTFECLRELFSPLGAIVSWCSSGDLPLGWGIVTGAILPVVESDEKVE